MKIDFSQVMRGPDGAELPEAPEAKTALTLGKVAAAALNQHRQGETSVQAARRGALALQVWGGGVHDLPPEDATLIREMLAAAWAPIVVAQAFQMLDPER